METVTHHYLSLDDLAAVKVALTNAVPHARVEVTFGSGTQVSLIAGDYTNPVAPSEVAAALRAAADRIDVLASVQVVA